MDPSRRLAVTGAEVAQHAVDLGAQRRLREAGADVRGHLRRADGLGVLADGTIWKGDAWHGRRRE
jgi:hypothetical protein